MTSNVTLDGNCPVMARIMQGQTNMWADVGRGCWKETLLNIEVVTELLLNKKLENIQRLEFGVFSLSIQNPKRSSKAEIMGKEWTTTIESLANTR
jgi:hypothetical protein